MNSKAHSIGLQWLHYFKIHDPTIHNPTFPDSLINYAKMPTLYGDNSQHHKKKKYNLGMYEPGLLGKENKPD